MNSLIEKAKRTLDERSVEYSSNTFLNENTYIGDVETVYVVGCNDQQDIVKALLLPYINQLKMTLKAYARENIETVEFLLERMEISIPYNLLH